MDQARAIELLKSANALLEGHFLLTSGNHSGKYIQCALLLSYPDKALEFMKDIAEHSKPYEIETVAAPAVGGIIVAYEVARLLGKSALFLERENGSMTLRRGFTIHQGERILIVEDVITTGSSVLEVSDYIQEKGGVVTAFASIVNRSSGRFKPEAPYYFCVEMNVPIYEPAKCPLCRKGLPVQKPGSRGIK